MYCEVFGCGCDFMIYENEHDKYCVIILGKKKN